MKYSKEANLVPACSLLHATAKAHTFTPLKKGTTPCNYGQYPNKTDLYLVVYWPSMDDGKQPVVWLRAKFFSTGCPLLHFFAIKRVYILFGCNAEKFCSQQLTAFCPRGWSYATYNMVV